MGTSKLNRSVWTFVCTTLTAIAQTTPPSTTPAPPTFTLTNLVANVAGTAKATDTNLVNPWGMTLGINSGVWIANNGSGNAKSYDGTGQALPAATPLTVTIPAPRNSSDTSAPTGVVVNATPGFVISSGGTSAPSTQIFATEDGTIAGWNSTVDPSKAIIAVDNSSSGAIYKGLAMSFNGSGAFLYATNFNAGTVDVFDSNFKPARIKGTFSDPKIPAGYAPFGIAAINGHLYVTYAQQDADKEDDVRGAGHGYINIFDTQGVLVKRFASQGQLNSPWGMAWAPFEGFGGFNNAVLVGNFGDGTINAFDFDSGDFIAKVTDSTGAAIKVPGLWALIFGLGVAQGSSSTIYFTAGGADEKQGVFGSLTVDSASVPKTASPAMTDSALQVTTVVSGLDQPTSMVFLGAGDFLVLEKASGKVQHVVDGVVKGTAIDLAVNSASERGLLGIALAPDFDQSHFVYLYWTQSTTNADSTNLAEVPLLGNRVDRYVWDPTAQKLTFNKNIIMLHAFQADANQPMRGNHNGGKIAFGPDGKLYVQIGDQGRRGQMQNLAFGATRGSQPDDQFGGPAPDNAHLTGVILRLNPDGTTPDDNPFSGLTPQALAPIEQSAGVPMNGSLLAEVTANIQKVYSYGRRNSFGLAFDPMTGFLWESENGDDAFDEINRITPGSNGGWIQTIGPIKRVADYKGIEATFTPLQGNLPVSGNLPFSAIDPASFVPALQQVRWPPSMIADTQDDAQSRLFVLPGSHYDDPEFSWKWAVAPAAIGFAGTGLGPQHAGNLFVGGSRTFLDEGYLFEFKFDASRRHFAFTDAKLQDLVDDNDYKFDEGESASLVAGKNFGIVTNIVSGPDGNLYVTSLSNGTVYMIK